MNSAVPTAKKSDYPMANVTNLAIIRNVTSITETASENIELQQNFLNVIKNVGEY